MKITFVSHTSVNVPRGVCYGQTDVPLSDTFTQEAEIIHNKLRSITENKPFDEVYTSPLLHLYFCRQWNLDWASVCSLLYAVGWCHYLHFA